MARPRIEISITGRRPKRSDSMPSTGPQTNCIRPQAAPKTNCQMAADAVASGVAAPKNERIRLGSTGIMIPNDRAFITAVA